MQKKRIILAGGSGFIGRQLVPSLQAAGFEVVVLTRTPGRRQDGVRELPWDGRTCGAWAVEVDGAEAIINLAGKSINCPHTAENIRWLTASRVESVRAVSAAIELAKQPPRVWIQASAIGFYGDTGSNCYNEYSLGGQDTLATICREWENAVHLTEPQETRKVILRFGLIFGPSGGVLPILARLTRWFLGGAAGNGRQYVSWLHQADLVAMVQAVLADEHFTGIYNAVAPESVTNAELMRELRRILHRPWSPPVPVLAVKLGSRFTNSDPSLALASQRCVPTRFLDAGFTYRFPELATALQDLLG